MIGHEQNGEYVDAERCRVEWENRREELKNRQLYELDLTHKKERNGLHNKLMNDLKKLDQFWAIRMD